MGALSPIHWLIIIGVLVLLFGAKRLPDAARSLGRSARILKAEVKDMNPDSPDTTAGTDSPPAGGSPAVLPPATATTEEVTASSASMTPRPPTPSGRTTPSTASGAAAVDGRNV